MNGVSNRDAFGGYHPLVNALYFALVIGFSMVLMHPVCLVISLIGALCYYIRLNGKGAAFLLLRYAVPVLLLTAVINPAFNHRGTVVLFYLFTGNPVTLESVLYGFAAALMLVSVLLWFCCFSAVMTSDKLIYLFGRILPALSLVLCMTLRLIPKYKAQLARIREAQAAMGRGGANGGFRQKCKSASECFSVMVTWALENAIITADSMKSRGYGLKGRTSFSVYTLTERDRSALLWLAFCGVYLLSGALSGGLFWRYFPALGGKLAEPMTVGLEIVYFALCMTPCVLDGKEDRVWKSLRSKI